MLEVLLLGLAVTFFGFIYFAVAIHCERTERRRLEFEAGRHKLLIDSYAAENLETKEDIIELLQTACAGCAANPCSEGCSYKRFRERYL